MNCDTIEELLPLYHDGGLTDEERAAVAEHLNSCSRCRESSKAFAALERTLTARRNELPRAGTLADAVLVRLGAPRRSLLLAPQWIATILTVIFALAVLLAHLIRYEPVASISERIETGYGAFVTLLTQMPELIVEAAGGEWWILMTVYLALTVSFVIVGRIVCRRIIE